MQIYLIYKKKNVDVKSHSMPNIALRLCHIKHGSTIEGEDLRSHLMPNTALGSCLLYKNGSTISRLPSCK